MIRLDSFTEADFDRFLGWIDCEKILYQFAGAVFNYPVTLDQLAVYIAEGSRIVYRVVELESDKVIGHCEINKIDTRNKSARLSRILIGDEKNRGKGYGGMVINELLKIGFDDLGLHRIELGVLDFNEPAIKCYENCGFKKEGLHRETLLIDGVYHSVYNMSILKNEWAG